jgi:7-cyano-7-deazaguanine synthase
MPQNQKSPAICLVSGGMDSCVTAAMAKAENEEIAFLHVSYGQRTERRERKAFEDIADFYGVEKRLAVSIEYLARIGGSSLTDKNIEVSEADLESKEIPTSYVPFRNANMLSIATSWAEVLGAGAIYIGAVAEDSSGYPDCRPQFYAAFERVIELGAPLHLSWSCYRNEDLACGACDSCALRRRGFERAGARDPIAYRQ